MKFLELTMRNFRSYGNNTTTIKLDFENPTLIVGKNYDSIVDGQVDSNGAGKTTILDGISVCSYDKTITGIDKNDMINYVNGKNMEVSLTFEKGGMFYKIVRYRANKALGGDGVKLYVNTSCEFTEEHDKTKDSVQNTNKEIERIMGIPFEIFSRIVIFSASYEPFLNLPLSHASKPDQKSVFEELFGLTELSRKAELLKSTISSTKKSIEEITRVNELLEQEMHRHDQHYKQTVEKSEAWELNIKTQTKELSSDLKPLIAIDVESLKGMLDDVEKIDKKISKVVSNIELVDGEIARLNSNNQKYDSWNVNREASIKSLGEKISKLKEVDVDFLKQERVKLGEYKQTMRELNTRKRELEGDLQSNKTNLSKVRKELEHLDSGECPYCNQEFLDNKHKMGECNNSITELTKVGSEISSEVDEVVLKLESLSETVRSVPEIPDNLDDIALEIVEASTELNILQSSENPHTYEDLFAYDTTLMDQKADLLDLKNSRKSVLDNINDNYSDFVKLGYDFQPQSLAKLESEILRKADKLESLKKSTNPYIEILEELKQTMKEISGKISNDELDSLARNLEHQNFLLKLLTRKDSFLRKALLNKNIPFLNSRMEYYLKKIGLTHKVVFDEEMAVHISQFGTQYKYKAMSSGQRARINLALVFSFRDVLQARFDKINFYILDECLDVGLGNVGVQLATKMIKNVALENNISMFVISHRDEISNMFDNKLEIELRNGFSSIK